jgi:hypothetical protein
MEILGGAFSEAEQGSNAREVAVDAICSQALVAAAHWLDELTS